MNKGSGGKKHTIVLKLKKSNEQEIFLSNRRRSVSSTANLPNQQQNHTNSPHHQQANN